MDFSDSILDSIKKLLGDNICYNVFDQDIIMHINSVFMTLRQLGVGPKSGYAIASSYEKWDDYLESSMNLEAVKTYIYLKVKLVFDPPSTSFVIDSINKQISELEWRLNVESETPSVE